MSSSAGIIIIGDEILSGRTKDTNINWIANQLNELGIKLKEARVIEDEKKIIINTVLEFSKKFTYVFTSGGIGPKLLNQKKEREVLKERRVKSKVLHQFAV